MYQTYFSIYLGGQCRFYPTCSAYAEQALQEGPFFTAIKKIATRILRCNPLCKGGVDFPQ